MADRPGVHARRGCQCSTAGAVSSRRPARRTETSDELTTERVLGRWVVGGVITATNLWIPESAEYATTHWPPSLHAPTSVPEVSSKISRALPVPVTGAP